MGLALSGQMTVRCSAISSGRAYFLSHVEQADSGTAPALSITGHETTSRKGLMGWTLYEFAYGPFFITFVMFVFSPYFSNVLIGDDVRGQSIWGYVATAAGLMIAIGSPILGALTDAAGHRKPGIATFTGISIAAMSLLWFATPTWEWAVPFAILMYLIAAVSSEVAGVLHNAMLPAIVSERRVGILSGAGLALSYLGAVVVFALWYLIFVVPDVPPFGLDGISIRLLLGPISAAWIFIFILPLFLFTSDMPKSGRSTRDSLDQGFRSLWNTIKSLKHYRNVATFLIARMVYYDGMIAIFTFVGVYAKGVFGWGDLQMMIYMVLMLSIGIFSSFAGGFLDDHIGSKKTLFIAVFMFGVGLAFGLVVTPDHVPWLPIAMQVEGANFPVIGEFLRTVGFNSIGGQTYVVCGIISTFFVGPALASSRTMLTRIVPRNMTAEFFGIYNLTGKMTAFLAPFAIAIATTMSGSQRAGMGVIFVFLFVGAFLLFFVKEERTEAI